MTNNADIPPFVFILGYPYLVINYDLEEPPGLEHYLLLRPLTQKEATRLQWAWSEVWASLVVVDEDRFRPR